MRSRDRRSAEAGCWKAGCVRRRFMAIYLNDHLAGATVGLELVRRAARENAGSSLGLFLGGVLLPEINEDRETLRRLMAELRIRVSAPKIAAAWTVEKIGRLKLNGAVRHYSPLSRLLELEGLAAGIDAKRALWLALAAAIGDANGIAGVDFDQLAMRAESQRIRLEEHRLAAAANVLR
jgi:hypothetical protein